jgi:hypothetical protein
MLDTKHRDMRMFVSQLFKNGISGNNYVKYFYHKNWWQFLNLNNRDNPSVPILYPFGFPSISASTLTLQLQRLQKSQKGSKYLLNIGREI